MSNLSGLLSKVVGGPANLDRINADAQRDADIHRVNLAFIWALSLTAIILAIVGWKAGATGPTLLWGMASIAAGAGTGFLFGIPRTGTDAKRSTSVQTVGQGGEASSTSSEPEGGAMRPNTNLEEVSDWLTKIIVGLGLVHLQDIEAVVQRTAANAAAAIAVHPGATEVSIATALIVSLAIEGFFGGYIYTRLFLQGAFARSDADLGPLRQKINQVVASAPTQEPTDSEQGSLPSAAQVRAAAEVEKLAANDPRVAVEKMQELAAEYERVRTSMASGLERTRQMTAVVGRMTVVALGADNQLAKFAASTRPGERLAAVVILKMRFEPAYSGWLAQRLAEDTPFIGFQAATALLAGSRLVGGDALEALRVAVGKANRALVDKGWKNDPSRDRIIDQILSEAKLSPSDVGGAADASQPASDAARP